MRDWGDCYQRIDARSPGPGNTQVWLSSTLRDPQWDDFLRSTPCGQFQQSGLWADFKAGEGWSHHRVILTVGEAIVAGFQVLWKKTRLGRIGYVSKGPIMRTETAELTRFLDGLLKDAASKLGLVALIVQPPDESAPGIGQNLGSDYILSNPLGVIEATYLVDVRQSKEQLFAQMSPSLRRNIKKAQRQAMTVREGAEGDLPRFFELMEATCRRQSTRPNPASLDAVRRLWHLFSETKSIRLTFAECQGSAPAAKLSLVFGDRMTVWKKGWDGTHGQWHPNEMLEYDALTWAHDHGCSVCDFCSFNRTAAVRMINGGQAGTEQSLSSRDEYHMRFGGFPKLLPSARILVPNAFLRWWYRNGYVRLMERRNQA
jgi:hypothetical protein